MNQTHPEPVHAEQRAAASSDGLIDVLASLLRQKKLILGLPLAVAIFVALLTFVMPPVYRAGATLLPPQQGQSTAASLLAQLGGTAGAMASAAGLKNPNDLYVGMLKSRTVGDNLVKRFSLLGVYDTASLEKAREKLQESTSIASAKSGLITVAVEDTDKARAAALANGYIEELVKLTKDLAVTEAAQRRLFFERQLEASRDKLAAAELALKKALDSRGVISVDSDSRAILATVAQVRAQISAKEIQLSSLKAFMTPNNQEYKRVSEELSSLRGELARLENGRPGDAPEGATSSRGLENIKLLRDVKYHQTLYELLSKQYEMARLDEAANSSVIQVLDPAVAPENKFKPRRTALVLVSAAVAFLFAIALAIVRDFWAKWRAANLGDEQWKKLRSSLRA